MNRTLHALADKVGILSSYIDQGGTKRHINDDTRLAILKAMGLPADTPEALEASFARVEPSETRLCDPCQVVREDEAAKVTLHLPNGFHHGVSWRVLLTRESGAEQGWEGKRTLSTASFQVPLPQGLPQGYHRLQVTLSCDGRELQGEQTLIVAPTRAVMPRDILGESKASAMGIWANLYTVRSAHNWGFGDCTDLGRLSEWAAQCGATFVGINPLHALRNRGGDISPYSPVSRLFRNLMYLDVEALPEWAACHPAQALLATDDFHARLQAARDATNVPYEQVLELKLQALKLLHATFVAQHRDSDTPRGHAYAKYLAQQGQTLQDFAAFCTLEDHFAAQGLPRAWQSWPHEYHDAHGVAVHAFARSHADTVDLHCFLQFELDRQLATVATRARAAGMPIGLYQDLAIGTGPQGSEPWAFHDLFVHGVAVGVPPDDYSEHGQNWGLLPIDPRKLTDDSYRYWRLLLRNAFAHSGALRLDHAMGLFRLFWIPEGLHASQGAYVRYPVEDMFAILALESQRHQAMVIGEDLGTVPRELPEIMQRWGILSSQVMYFEKNNNNQYAAADKYSERALVTTNTHDLAPLNGFFASRDLQARRDVGHITDDKPFTLRQEECNGLRQRLHADKCLAHVDEADPAVLTQAVHHFLRTTPAPLIGLSLDDLVAETEPVNMPGVGPDVFASWSRRMRLTLEELADSRTVRRAFGDLPPTQRAESAHAGDEPLSEVTAY